MLAAFAEERRPGLFVIRIGPRPVDHPIGYGDPYVQVVTADTEPGPALELLGMAGRFTREHHDAIGLCLILRGFLSTQHRRYKNGAAIPMPPPQRIHLSSTFLGEIVMSIDQAHAHAQKVFETTMQSATNGGHTAFANAIGTLGDAAERGIAAGKSGDLRAQGDATRDIFHALATVQEEGLKLPQTEPVHHEVVNLFNSMRNVSNAIDQANMARMHAAMSGATAA